MRKNAGLIRKILLYVIENGDGRTPLDVPYFCRHEPRAVEYHVRLCEDEKLLILSKGEPMMDAPEGQIVGIVRITAAGHRELERLSDD